MCKALRSQVMWSVVWRMRLAIGFYLRLGVETARQISNTTPPL